MHRHHANSHAIEAPPCRLHRRRPYRPLPAAGPAPPRMWTNRWRRTGEQAASPFVTARTG